MRDLDRDGAVAAFEKALELDPLGRKPASKLAEALTFAPDGSRFNPGARMDEALDVLRRELQHDATSEKAKPALRQLETIILTYSGRYEELRRRRDETASARIEGYDIEAAAAVDGVEAALSIAGEIADPRMRRTAIWQAASQLLHMRRYRLSQDLYEAVAQAAAAAAPRDPQADGYDSEARKAAGLQRHEELRTELEGPQQAAHDWILLPYRDDWRDEMTRLSGSSCGESEICNPEAGAEFERQALTARYATGVMGPAIDHAADWTASHTSFVVEGDAETGYWVRGYSTLGSPTNRPWMVAFIERQDGEFKILDATTAVRPSLADLGCTLSKRLERDGLESVQVWLNRIAQTQLPGLDQFQTFWCEQCLNSPADAKTALALLRAADAGLGDAVIPVLEQAYRQEKGLDRRSAAALGWAAAFKAAGEPDQAAALLTELADEQPLLTPVVVAAAQAQADLGQVERAQALLQSGLEASRQNPDLLRWQLTLAMRQGNVAEAQTALEHLEAISHAGSADYNNVAWTGVVAGEANPIALTAIRKGLSLAKNSPHLLNTEAALQALGGKPDRARALWYQAVFRAHAPEPSEGDYFVAGLILEQYGLLDEARLNYERAAAGPANSPADSASLAAKALERLSAR